MQGNFVAKHMNKVNRAAVHKDRKKAVKLSARKQKHKGRQFDGPYSLWSWLGR